MEHVRGVQVRPRDLAKSMNNVLAQIVTIAGELDVSVV